ncbi:FAD binding domain-containing protein [Clostridium saccharoperbutylacetonicum]|uniref:Aerobic-type carbon monoxide dehydrogenase, middle subunit CoxM/CutM n=1 Tax=Clostridium saccharoperbutylacetonicum N1-4(HMT) TaxID=931276 RepID=M1MIU0_9CLOT|nr:FAD binding domain-containing protein [Clostridium saccharoperbutylacetonicum]AGF54746.1 aerobic-type carbon monoxide dehydrogenase, middle subunit CoxM/CutM [Clostridium saccharoperbutylacetonicum N1-4(HMT)]AQR93705.1 nicotinate dehydrogenase FAD-subunit [Clostridium saccharoperbutylacetonicum]NRT58733.1 CO/xanthine dehydrogenase FAD-binding subunit [Clostridium saccharoperbutylacetonicum]NSB27922.1 CO/xanthine dehydrogenase FAD-binding subunit [Clostridium saccharoperbutylacetonicum]NSB29
MIPFDFEYYKPETVEETVNLYKELNNKGKKPLYYGGGTEIISMARAYNIYTEAVIDIKGIAECNVMELDENKLIIGAAVTLTQIAEANLFPLLSLTVKRIADHTIQDKITLGGNIAGTIIYRESVLPLLICNSQVVIAGLSGRKQVAFKDIFDKRIKIDPGEFIVKVIVEDKYLNLEHLHVKRTKNDKIDYPLITLAAIKDDEKINIAFSGVCDYPFRSSVIENYLNDKSLSVNERINNIICNMPVLILNDLSGSAEYRKFMLQKMLLEVLEKMEED